MSGIVLIVDDEALARERLRRLLAKHAHYNEVVEAEDGVEAVSLIQSTDFSLIFLDIQMPGLGGFEVVEEIGIDEMPPLVFVTAYDEYALRAFDVHAIDYLLKPYTEERFVRTLQRALAPSVPARRSTLRRAIEDARGSRFRERFMVRHKDDVAVIKVSQIDWIEAANNYVKLVVGNTNYLLREGISSIETQLDPTRFVRVHRSVIVNIERIKSMKPWFSGDYILHLHSGQQLRLSRTHRDKLAQAMAADSPSRDAE